jgi:hypothetical protein
MLITWVDVAAKKEQYNELLREAETERLLRAMQTIRPKKKWQSLFAVILNRL